MKSVTKLVYNPCPLDSCLDAVADAGTDLLVQQLTGGGMQQKAAEAPSSSTDPGSPRRAGGWSKLRMAVLTVGRFKSGLKTR